MASQNRYPRHHSDPSELKRQIDFRDVVERYWGPGKCVGNTVQYPSPWRDDGQKDSFTVYADGFKDFGGDGEHGDLFDWLIREGIVCDFPAALQWTEDYLGGSHRIASLPPVTPSPSVPSTTAADWEAVANAALAEAQRYLWSSRRDSRRIQQYLNEARDLTEATIRHNGLGYNPYWLKTAYCDPETGRHRHPYHAG